MTTTAGSSSSPSALSQLEAVLARPSPLELSRRDVQLLLPRSVESRPVVLAILARSTSPGGGPPSRTTLEAIESTIVSLLSDNPDSTTEQLVEGISLVSNLVKVSPNFVASHVLAPSSPVRSTLADCVVRVSSNSATDKGKQRQSDETLAVVELLSLAASEPVLRALVDDSAGQWLDTIVARRRDGERPRTTALAALGLVKLELAKLEQTAKSTGLPPNQATARKSSWSLEDLAETLVETAIRVDDGDDDEGQDDSVVVACLEGLAYLTLAPSRRIKEIASRRELLVRIFSYAPLDKTLPSRRASPGRDYSIATLLNHLTSFPNVEDAQSDAAQVERLKRFASRAQAGGGSAATRDAEKETAEQVTARISFIANCSPSPIPTLRQLCLSPSLQTRRLAGSILHSLVTPQSLRGRLLQAGVHRLLLTLVRHLPTPFDVALDLAPVQALSKLLITANPLLVFGPTPAAPLLFEATVALTLPLDPASSSKTPLLATFESLMALTNVASLDPELTDRIASMHVVREKGGVDHNRPAVSLLDVLEGLLVHSHTMVRRAATELVCNLVGSEPGIAFFEPRPTPQSSSPSSSSTSRLHVLLALSASDDVPTRLAASGALTSLASSEPIATTLASRREYVDLLLALVRDDEPGVRHRAYEVWSEIARVVVRVKSSEAVRSFKDRNVVSELERARGREDVGGELEDSVERAVEQVKTAVAVQL